MRSRLLTIQLQCQHSQNAIVGAVDRCHRRTWEWFEHFGMQVMLPKHTIYYVRSDVCPPV